VGKEYGLEIKKQKQKINGKINGVPPPSVAST
jgi:hypothetical protein